MTDEIITTHGKYIVILTAVTSWLLVLVATDALGSTALDRSIQLWSGALFSIFAFAVWPFDG